ncbi:MAG: ABC transporter permease [Lachnospiraceae bacterium]|nr:ABC transporter permease [Lachnospiraceae bacterium]
MKSMMRKTTFREIKQSLGRYLAILAIISLGVGFFAGLKETRDTMVTSAGEYLNGLQLYDYRLLSTLGFEEEAVEALAQKEGVRAVEGAVSADILYIDDAGNENVLKIHSLTNTVNATVLTAGRMPENASECVVDNLLFDESAIGTQLVLSENNKEEDLDHFSFREYTITGLVQSSYYIQFERGNTSLGSGRISGFAYLLPDGFAMDYYTEIFVKFDADYTLYSEEYEAFLDKQQPLWEAYTDEVAMRRYDELIEDAKAELADAESELAETVADAEAELADAERELLDGEAKLADAEAEFLDAERDIADARKELDIGWKELADAEKELADGEIALADAKITLEENEALLAGKQQEYEDGMRAYTSGKEQIAAQQRELDAARIRLNTAQADLDNGQALFDSSMNSLQGGFAGGLPDDFLDNFPDGLPDGFLDNLPNELIEELMYLKQLKIKLETGRAELAAGWAQVNAGTGQLNSANAQLNGVYAQLLDAEKQLTEGWEELNAGWEEYYDGEIELENARAEIKDARRKLLDGEKELADGEAELADARVEIEDARQELLDGWEEYYDGQRELAEEVADAEAKIADARAEIDDIDAPDIYVLGRNTNVGYVMFENDSGIVEGMSNVFPVMFFLVAALVCMTTMNRMVEEQRIQIGVLKALGYGEGAIMGKYLFYSGSAAIAGGLLGFVFGTLLFPTVIWVVYGIMYRLGDIVHLFDLKIAVISLAVAALCSMGTTWFTCRQELREVAADLMRPKAPKAGKRVFLEHVPFIWRHLKFLHKVSVRNIVRYKKRFFMMVLGISGCTALLLTGFGIRDSVTDIANLQFETIHIFDMSITLQDRLSGTGDEEILKTAQSYGVEVLPVLEESWDLEVDGTIKAINLVIAGEPEHSENFLDLHTGDGISIAYPGEGEAVISDKLAETYGLKAGDEIFLYNGNRTQLHAVISGICENYIYNYVYLTPQTYEKQVGVPEYKSLYLNVPEAEDVHRVGAALMMAEGVTGVNINEDIRTRVSGMMGSMNYIVIVIIFSAGSLAFVVLYNLNNINITERLREIATIKVLGFYKKETEAYVFRENIALTAIGCAVGLVLGKLLHLFVMGEINIDMISFDVQIRPSSYVFSVLLTFVFTWFINRLMSGKLNRINMAESLKSVD